MQQFVNGLRDPDTKARLIFKRCANLDEALSCARLSEVANKTLRGAHGSTVLAILESSQKTSGQINMVNAERLRGGHNFRNRGAGQNWPNY